MLLKVGQSRRILKPQGSQKRHINHGHCTSTTLVLIHLYLKFLVEIFVVGS
jgi:hypothetical protein